MNKNTINKSLALPLGTILIYACVALCYSCGTKTSNLSKNIDVEITKQTIENCTYFCHYIDFKITNNNDVGIYMPWLRDYFEIINSHGDTITYIVNSYETYNEFANGNTSDYYIYRRKIEVNNAFSSLDDEEEQWVDSEYKKLTNALPKNIALPSGREEDVKRELALVRYFPIIRLPPKSSTTISVGINYLFYNYILEENYIVVGHDRYNLSDPDAKRYSVLYDDYEKNKSPEVKVIFNYTPRSPYFEDGIIDFPLSYFGDSIPGRVNLSAKHPKKFLYKYYLVDKLKGKDSLIIKFENGF